MWQQSFLDIKKYYLALAIFVVISSVQCQNRPSVEPEHIDKPEGESAEVLCRFGQAIQRCRFEQVGTNRVLKLNPSVQRNDIFQYYGEGLDKGHCGMSISRLSIDLEGNWTCHLDMGDEFEDIVGNFDINIARAPQEPQLVIQDLNRLREGDDLLAECSYRDGKPTAVTRWFLGDEEITPNESFNTNQNANEVVSSKIRRLLRADDNLKSLICRVEHPAFESGYTNTSNQLHVNYQPQALSKSELYIGSLTIGSSADIAITIRSNPRPTLEWTIDGKTLREGTQNERFVVNSAQQVEDGRYLAKLTVIQLTQEDTTKTFNLRAFNEFGTQDYAIRIGGSPDENASGLGVVAIIGIIVAALVLLVIVSLLVVARITKRWCFAGASMHPNSPDSEAQIAPDEDKIHEQYEPHTKVSDEETTDVEPTKTATNGKSNGNTSV